MERKFYIHFGLGKSRLVVVFTSRKIQKNGTLKKPVKHTFYRLKYFIISGLEGTTIEHLIPLLAFFDRLKTI